MKEIKRSQKRINTFETKYKSYKEFLGNYMLYLSPDDSDKQALFNKIKELYEFYIKSLRDILKEEYNIILYCPTQILKKSEDLNLINNSLPWLKYIELLNEIIQSEDVEEAKIKRFSLVDKYKDYIDEMHNNICVYYKEYEFKNFCNEKVRPFPENKPKYLPREIGLNKDCYNLILKFFKKHNNVERVWLHGSRVSKKIREASDIDFIAKGTNIDNIREEIKYLPIPNRIDIVAINEENQDFVNKISKTPTRLIYRREDFCDDYK